MIRADQSELVAVVPVHAVTRPTADGGGGGSAVERELALIKVAGTGEKPPRIAAPRRHLPGAVLDSTDREIVSRGGLDREGQRA